LPNKQSRQLPLPSLAAFGAGGDGSLQPVSPEHGGPPNLLRKQYDEYGQIIRETNIKAKWTGLLAEYSVTPVRECSRAPTRWSSEEAQCHRFRRVTLVLKHASASRPSGECNDDDYDVLADSVVVGRIFRGAGSPEGLPWMWTLAFGQHEDRTPTHGYEPTREGAMAAFAKQRPQCPIPKVERHRVSALGRGVAKPQGLPRPER
jgi:hypothetical protein